MSNLPSPHEERALLLARCEATLDLADQESRALTPTEQESYDRDTTRIRALNLQIEGQSSRPTFRAQPSNEISEVPYFAGETQSRIAMPTFHAGAKLQAFANTRDGHAQAYRTAQWLRGSLLGDPKALGWCERNGLQVDVRAAHSAGENAKGGVLVPDEFTATVIRLVETYGVFRRNSRVIPMSSDTLNIPRRTGGLTASYVGEGVAGTESDTSWDNVALVAKKMMVLTRMSSEIAEDALISMADMLAMECALAFALKEDTVGFTGTGIGSDGGITGVLVKALQAGYTKSKVACASGHDTLAEIDGDDLTKLMAAVPAYAKPRAKFYCSPTALDLVFNAIKMAGGGNTFENLANAVEPRFLGYPIELSTLFADDATATYNGAVMIGFGDLSQATTLGSRREIRFATTDSAYWAEDQIGVKATMRHDINVHDLGSTAVKSPFAVLCGTT